MLPTEPPATWHAGEQRVNLHNAGWRLGGTVFPPAADGEPTAAIEGGGAVETAQWRDQQAVLMIAAIGMLRQSGRCPPAASGMLR